MKTSFGTRHGPSLGPGQYNPAYPRAIEIKDQARQSSSFKSGSQRMHVKRPSYNLGPGQHDAPGGSIRVREPNTFGTLGHEILGKTYFALFLLMLGLCLLHCFWYLLFVVWFIFFFLFF